MANFSQPFSRQLIRQYDKSNAVDNMVRAMTSDPIGWVQLMNQIFIKNQEMDEAAGTRDGKMVHYNFPNMIDLGTGGIYAAHARYNYGPAFFEHGKYTWIGSGEEDWYLQAGFQSFTNLDWN